MRYTPAGMPIVNAVLQHRSQQMEAGIARLSEFEVPQLLRAKFQAGSSDATGRLYQFTGFSTRKAAIAKAWCFTSLILVLSKTAQFKYRSLKWHSVKSSTKTSSS
jgi:primosomal replication protein N